MVLGSLKPLDVNLLVMGNFMNAVLATTLSALDACTKLMFLSFNVPLFNELPIILTLPNNECLFDLSKSLPKEWVFFIILVSFIPLQRMLCKCFALLVWRV